MAARSHFHIDPAWYHAPDRAAQEWTFVWSRLWHMGPRAQELPEPGDVMVHSLGRESLLFVRDEDGAVRGYFNVCRHRANRLLLAGDGPSHAAAFTCAFHGWRYGLDGALRDVPCRKRFDARIDDPAATSLASFRVDEFAGWLWFTLDPEAPSLADFLGPLHDRLSAYRMERATIVDYKTFDFACNWKTVLDAFNESYHFQALHREILAWGNEDAPITLLGIHSMMVNEYGAPSALYPDQTSLNPSLAAYLEATGIDPAGFTGTPAEVRLAAQAAKRARQDDSVYPYASLDDGQLTDAYHYLVFPSLHLNLFPEFYVAMRYRPHPSGDPERMYFDFIMCAPLAEGETVPEYTHRVVRGGAEPVGEVLEWGVRKHAIAEMVLGQDVDLVEHVQRGLRSQSFAEPLLGADERRIPHFHETIDRLIRGATVRDIIALREDESLHRREAAE